MNKKLLDIPWTEKYRPNNISDIYTQNNINRVLNYCIENNNIPNLLLYGHPGTGKTSTILAICRQLFGSSNVKNRTFMLNASDDRGINIVREKIKQFANTSISDYKFIDEETEKECQSPSFKVIILDEADNMTIDAQSALRRIMETTAKTTRFCIICNNVNKIIEPIGSRCVKFRYIPLSYDNIEMKLNQIIKLEGLNIDSKIKNNIIIESGGDARKAINILECISCYDDVSQQYKLFYDITGNIEQPFYNKLISGLLNASVFTIEKQAERIIQMGCNISKLIEKICFDIANDSNISELDKAEYIIYLNYILKQLYEGCDETIILISVLCKLKNIYISSK